MSLTNNQMDLVGALRGMNWLLLLWNVEPLTFPVDDVLRSLLTQRRASLKEAFLTAAQLAGLADTEFVSEIDSAVDGVIPEDGGSDDEKTTNLWLSLYGGTLGKGKCTFFSYDRPEAFIEETKPVLMRLLANALWAIIVERYLRYEVDSSRQPPPADGWIRLCETLCSFLPDKAGMPTPDQLVKDSIATLMARISPQGEFPEEQKRAIAEFAALVSKT